MTTTTKLKDPPPSPSETPTPSDSPTAPTYATSKASRHYVVAKTLLNEGDFETALTTLEEGMAALQQQQQLKEEDSALHPSLAPFHYLYGTTLLYSMEESSQEDAMAIPSSNGEADEEEADDLQIAFEHLEAARLILETIIKEEQNDSTYALDLAQVYLRAGDLQRLNGHYTTAISDYQECLKLRKLHLSKYDRKLADVHYQLALVYSLAIVDKNNGNEEEETKANDDDDDQKPAAKTSVAENDEATKQTAASEDDKLHYRQLALEHYGCCAQVLWGQVVRFCSDQDPTEETTATACATSPVQRYWQMAKDIAKDSKKTSNNMLEIQNLLDLLQEIHETVEHLVESEQGIRQVQEIKQEITAAVAAAAEESEETSGSTTTIGFGSTEPAKTSGTTTIGFGNSATTTATDSAPVVLQVRKKKRTAEHAPLPAEKSE